MHEEGQQPAEWPAIGAVLDAHGIAAIGLHCNDPVWSNETAAALVAGDSPEPLEARLREALELHAALPRTAGTVAIRFAANHALLELDASAVVSGDQAMVTFDPKGPSSVVADPHIARLEAMLEATSDIITVIDTDGAVRFSNYAAGRITGLAGTETNGRPFIELVHPDDVEAAVDAYARGLVGGETIPPVDLRIRFADGQWRNVEAQITPTRFVIDGADCAVVTLRDVTDRVRRQAEVESSRRRLEHLVEHLDDVIVVLNPDLSVQWASPGIERLVDAPAYTNVGENAFNDMHEDDVPQVLAAIESVMREPGSRRETTLRLLHARDGWRTVEASIVNRLEEDAVRGLVCTLRPASDDSRSNDRDEMSRLREADRLKDVFLASLSHEMRTPLTAIVGFAEIVAAKGASLAEDERAALVRRIGANARELADMVERMLDFSILQAGRAHVSLGPVVVAHVVADLVDRLDIQLGDHDVELETDETAVATADPQALDHVVRNLLTNAARYSAAGTTITVRVRREGGEVAVDVIDQGIGIPEEEQARVFQSFYRVAPAATRQRGTGIGLNIARRYAQLQGGRLQLTSRPGVGSTFTLVLPAS